MTTAPNGHRLKTKTEDLMKIADLAFRSAWPAPVSAPAPTGACTFPAAAASAAQPEPANESASQTESASTPPESADENLVKQRREALQLHTDPDRVALALSGGGIRSATFSLGVVQALAEAPSGCAPVDSFKSSLLSRIDYLSTVSGGGYLGGFLCSLFLPGRLRAAEAESSEKHHSSDKSDSATKPPQESPEVMRLKAANDAVRVLISGPPGRMRADDDFKGDDILKAPLRWLRENGRYLLPTGSGNAVYAMALGLRNWVSLHCVIGTVLVSVLALLMLLRAWGATDDTYREWEMALLGAARAGHNSGDGMDRIWWSPLTVLCVVPVASFGFVLGAAYWLVQEREDGCSSPFNSSVVCMTLVGAALMCMAALQWHDYFWAIEQARRGELVQMWVALALGTVALLSLPFYMCVSLLNASAARQRVALTRGLAATLRASAVIAGLGIVDTAGQSLYLAAFQPGSTAATKAATLASPAALAGGLAWLVRRLGNSEGGKWPDFVRKLPLMSLAGLAGIVIFILVGALWAMLVHLMVWGIAPPSPWGLSSEFLPPAIPIRLVVVSLAMALVIGFFPAFINLSSLQPFYGSRLTRAYLGASNGRRFEQNNKAHRSAAEPIDGDEVRLSDYVDENWIRTLAPLHIINVCVNKTVDPAEQLVQRDRKGLPLAVLPCGLALDSDKISPFPSPQKSRPLAWLAGLFQTSVNRPLTVGQWIGTSGAAFSTGIGRETTLGMSLLMGAANVRLGTWWSTGSGHPGTPDTRVGPAMPTWLRKAAGLPFRTQRYLSYELRASFHGTNRTWQYLSDGGHFENTAIYELLRSHRRVKTIFACDNGADPEYRFDDLANLIRLARIDLQVRIEVVDPPKFGPLEGLFGRPETFRSIALRQAGAAAAVGSDTSATAPPQGLAGPVGVLLYAWNEGSLAKSDALANAPASLVTQIVLIKPLVTGQVPADVRQYAAVHPSFPQEPTADQFFDEAQWESYRALGDHQARRIFQPNVLQALDEARLAWTKPSRQ
jgi:hypothetical protein